MEMLKLVSLVIIWLCTLDFHLVSSIRGELYSRFPEKQEAVESVRRTTPMPYYGTNPTTDPNPDAAATRNIRQLSRRYSWEFGDPSLSPWTGFLFTLTIGSCDLGNYCGAIIAKPHILLTSCACLRSFFVTEGFNGRGANFGLNTKKPWAEGMDLQDLPIYVFHSFYKSLWTDEMLNDKWPWKLIRGENSKYMRLNYHCWQSFLNDNNCQPSGTGQQAWEDKNCGISTVAVFGIGPPISFIPELPWPPVPTFYENLGGELLKTRNGEFWRIPWGVPLFDEVGFSVTTYFMRLANNTNYLRGDIGKIIYLPETLITMKLYITNQSDCLGEDWLKYYQDNSYDIAPRSFKSDVTCMMARDPIMLKAYATKLPREVMGKPTVNYNIRFIDSVENMIRLCGSEAGFPVWSSRGLHGMTVKMINCEKQSDPQKVASIPFTKNTIAYIEAIEPSFVGQEPFDHFQYDVADFKFEIITTDYDDAVLDSYLNKVKPKSGSPTGTPHFRCIFICLIIFQI